MVSGKLRMVPVMIDKLKGVTIPPFQFTKSWTFDEISDWWRKLKLRREVKKIIKNVREKRNVGKF